MNTKKERDLNLLKKKQGFTLVEVLVVLVILAILIAIAVPSVTAYIGKAKDRKDLIELNNVKKAFELMMLEDVENGYFGSSTSEESNDESNFLYNNATNFIYGVGDD
ncbi:MAG: prepilin-type N-terminal cleavage/methylation domain-containing protein, partial [Clostridiales Family XIII bacterium]|nr:prepilin-type N-terminal cleavage/methylation domain-containing protein [Clostridiales Family XIII bacterium]